MLHRFVPSGIYIAAYVRNVKTSGYENLESVQALQRSTEWDYISHTG